jgi:hypothetical protein
MGRTVITWRDMERYIAKHPPQGFALEGGARVDDYTSRILKYIPIEVVTVTTVLEGIVRSGANAVQLAPALWAVFLFGLIATPIYLWRMQRVQKIEQLLISTGAFAVWAFAVGGPFELLGWYAKWMGSALLVIYTFSIPLIGGFPDRSYHSTMPKE